MFARGYHLQQWIATVRKEHRKDTHVAGTNCGFFLASAHGTTTLSLAATVTHKRTPRRASGDDIRRRQAVVWSERAKRVSCRSRRIPGSWAWRSPIHIKKRNDDLQRYSRRISSTRCSWRDKKAFLKLHYKFLDRKRIKGNHISSNNSKRLPSHATALGRHRRFPRDTPDAPDGNVLPPVHPYRRSDPSPSATRNTAATTPAPAAVTTGPSTTATTAADTRNGKPPCSIGVGVAGGGDDTDSTPPDHGLR